MLLLAEHDAGLLRCARLMARLLDRNKGGRGAESGGSVLRSECALNRGQSERTSAISGWCGVGLSRKRCGLKCMLRT